VNSTAFWLVLGVAGVASSAEPIIDNERVSVWDTVAALPPAPYDFVAIPLTAKGTASFSLKGQSPGKAGSHEIIVELKDHPVAPIQNTSSFPLAFPRPRSQKLLENDRVVVWSYRWNPGEPTPMHFHDKDAVVVFEEDTALKSTTPDGKSVVTETKSGEVRFSLRERTHSEVLVAPSGSAVIVELK